MLSVLENSSRRPLSTGCDASSWPWSVTNSWLAKVFWWLNICSCLFRSPSDMWAVIIHEWCVGRPLELDRTTETHDVVYPLSFLLRCLWRVDWERVVFMSNRGFLIYNMDIGITILICLKVNSGYICQMIYKFSSSAKCCANIPQLNWGFMYNILDIAGSSFSCSLVFYVGVVSVVLYTDNPVTICPF